jgi:hypothetical protein
MFLPASQWHVIIQGKDSVLYNNQKYRRIYMTRLNLGLITICSLLGFLLTACNPISTEPSTLKLNSTSEPATLSTTAELKSQVPSDTLKPCCQPPVSSNFNSIGITEGETAVKFNLNDTIGNDVSLSGLLQEKPLVLVLGSFT